MAYQMKPLSCAPARLHGLSEKLIAMNSMILHELYFDVDNGMVPGARWLDIESIDEWSKTLPRDREIVLYCAHGKTISNTALDRLHALGFKARFIEGGMAGWKDAGGVLAAKS